MPDIGNVDMRLKVMAKYAKLYKDEDNFDVILDVQGQKIKAHRLVLAVHSNFFRILMLGQSFKEAHDDEIKLKAPLEAFKILLTYMYTGTVDLRKFPTQQVTELLELSHCYYLPELEKAIVKYLSLAVDAESACVVLRAATLIENIQLKERCQLLIRMVIEGLFEVKVDLSFEMLKTVLEKYKEGRNEIKWFEAVFKFTSAQGFCSDTQKAELKELIDLKKMTPEQLIEVVKPTKTINDGVLLELIGNVYKTKVYRDKNYVAKNASVIKGKQSHFLLKPGKQFAFHEIEDGDDKADCILVDLGAVYCFNHIRMFLNRWNHFYIEVSTDEQNWFKVINYDKTQCTEQQMLFFPETVGRFIKVVGLSASGEPKIFECNCFEVMLVSNPPVHFNGLIVPSQNVVLIDKSEVYLDDSLYVNMSKKILSVPFVEAGINTPFASAQINQQSLSFYLYQPYLLSSCRFKLWDYDDRKYSYTISTTKDNLEESEIVSDKRAELLSGWLTVRFSPRMVGGFIIRGTRATIGNEIRIAKFQAPAPDATA